MKRYLLLTILLLTSLVALPQSKSTHDVYSAMMYNIFKYIQWPDDNSPGNFVVGIMGDDDLLKAMQASYKGKNKGSKSLTVKKIESTADVAECHVVFVTNNGNVSAVKTQLDGKPVLLVTNGEGLARKGSILNFVTEAGKLRFELNQAALQKANLKASGALTSLAILI